MTDIEQKALALFNEVARERGSSHDSVLLDRAFIENEAFCRAIEQHEAFRQEVSDAVKACGIGVCHPLHKFVIPKPVDPLVEAAADLAAELAEKQIKADKRRKVQAIVYSEAKEA